MNEQQLKNLVPALRQEVQNLERRMVMVEKQAEKALQKVERAWVVIAENAYQIRLLQERCEPKPVRNKFFRYVPPLRFMRRNP